MVSNLRKLLADKLNISLSQYDRLFDAGAVRVVQGGSLVKLNEIKDLYFESNFLKFKIGKKDFIKVVFPWLDPAYEYFAEVYEENA